MIDAQSELGSTFVPSDQTARETALDVHRSFIVQAPAGSGKTGLLVQRYLALLAQVDEPEEILAITFTRKATGEMRERVLKALASTLQPLSASSDAFIRSLYQLACSVCARDTVRGWQLQAHPSRLRILTIDALNASLTRQLPLLSGFGSSPRITDQARELYHLAARRTVRGEDMDDIQFQPVQALLAHLDGDYQQTEALLAAMLAQRQQWQAFLGLDSDDRALLEQALQREIAAHLSELAQQLQPQAATLCEILMFAAQRANAAKETEVAACSALLHWPNSDVTTLADWRGVAALLLTQSGTWRKRWDKNIGIPPKHAFKEQLETLVAAWADNNALLDSLRLVRLLPTAHYQDQQWALLADLLHVLRFALAHLQLVFQERGTVDHTEVAMRARQALGDDEAPTDLALKLDYRIHHILVDEFQDTSRPQVDLLKRLTAGWLPDDGRSLFLVGDPMQSIYRFRQAEVGLFLQARRHGLGAVDLHSLALKTNFRSHPALVSWVNQVFSYLFPETNDIAGSRVAYNESVAAVNVTNHEIPAASVNVHPLVGERVLTAKQEAHRVAELAAQLLADDAATTTTAILVRRRQDLAAIIPALRAAKIAFEAVEIESLARQPVVQDLYALTRALLHPTDTVAWLAVLRAPWCGLNLSELHALVGSNPHHYALPQRLHQSDILADGPGRQRLQRIAPILHEAAQQRRRGPLRRLVENTWRRLGGPACLTAARERADADAFFELLEQMEVAADCGDALSIGERLNGLYARPDVSAQAARLKLMTIHKAKGLEFDHVILPGLNNLVRSSEQRLLSWMERSRGATDSDLLLGPLQAKGGDSDPIQAYIRALEAGQSQQEQLRLLYVAVTRARQQLHLFGAVEIKTKANAEAELAMPNKGSLLSELWPFVKTDFERAWQLLNTTPNQFEGEQTELFAAPVPQHQYQRLPADWSSELKPEPVQWHEPIITSESAEAIPFAWAGMRARHVGTVVHAWLERIAQQGLEFWNEDKVRAEQGLIEHRLRLLGVPTEHLLEARTQVVVALNNTLTDDTGRWLLMAHREAACELALNAWLDNKLHTLIIDRTFIDADGTRWIIDYKSSSHQGADLNAFLQHEQQRYRAQLLTYARALRGLEQRPIRLALYFPLLQRLVEVTEED